MIDLERFHRGDRAYFSKVVETYGWLVLRVVEAHRQDYDESQDLFQEIWLRVWEKKGSFSGSGIFEGWLHRVAQNTCLRRNRARRGRSRLHRELMHRSSADLHVWSPSSPGEEVERKERRQRFHRALTCLTDRERQAITLRMFEDKDTREVAEIMGIKPNTVRSIIRHGMDRLQDLMMEGD
jgi:RNA polymerase sigma-70 factor (ECF subfamily)